MRNEKAAFIAEISQNAVRVVLSTLVAINGFINGKEESRNKEG